jgi:hypothetical protein
VTSVSDISVGDKIRLDIDSVGHGIETVTVTHVGTETSQTNLAEDASAGATKIRVRRINGFAAGDKITVGTPASKEEVTVTAVGGADSERATIDFTPALTKAHIRDEWVVSPGTGLDLAAPLKFNHSANLPFSDRGTGITFQPATAFAHSSNEPVLALGTGITLDRPLTNVHDIDAVVYDARVTTAGYQAAPEPNQWFGGPEFTTNVILFGRFHLTLREGSMVVRDASGLVVDSLNYGALVDPWAAEGYQAASGPNERGCFTPSPGPSESLFGVTAAAGITNTSAGRSPDGADTDSNCTDFLTQAATTLSVASPAGATNIKVASVEDFEVGRKVMIDTGANGETAIIAKVGTAGATTVGTATAIGATVIPVPDAIGFREGQTITIDSDANSETAVVASVRGFGATSITLTAPLTHAHEAGTPISGTGITLTTALTRAHDRKAQVSDNVPTPGAPNRYDRSSH